MKTFRYLIVAVLFLLVAGTSGAQTRKEKKEALKTYVTYSGAYPFTFRQLIRV